MTRHYALYIEQELVPLQTGENLGDVMEAGIRHLGERRGPDCFIEWRAAVWFNDRVVVWNGAGSDGTRYVIEDLITRWTVRPTKTTRLLL